MLSAVLFELEGVLLETAPLREAALRRALADEGVRAPVSFVAAAARASWHDLSAPAAAALPDADATTLDLLALRARRHFAELAARRVTLAPGAAEAVAQLASRVPLAVVTRATRQEADALLALSGLRDRMAFVVAAEDAPRKAAGYARAVQRIARRLGPRAASRTPLALEDTLDGIRAATAAGLPVVAVGALPAHEAVSAAGSIDTLEGLTVERLERVAGIGAGHIA